MKKLTDLTLQELAGLDSSDLTLEENKTRLILITYSKLHCGLDDCMTDSELYIELFDSITGDIGFPNYNKWMGLINN